MRVDENGKDKKDWRYIEFDVGKSTIRPNSYPLLDSIVTFLKIYCNISASEEIM